METINRGAVILKYQPKAVKWLNDADPYEDGVDISMDRVRQDRTVYLVSDADANGEKAVNRWIEANYDLLFEYELYQWYTDPSLWPEDRTLEKFREWFDVEYHSWVVDTVGDVIYSEDI